MRHKITMNFLFVTLVASLQLICITAFAQDDGQRKFSDPIFGRKSIRESRAKTAARVKSERDYYTADPLDYYIDNSDGKIYFTNSQGKTYPSSGVILPYSDWFFYPSTPGPWNNWGQGKVYLCTVYSGGHKYFDPVKYRSSLRNSNIYFSLSFSPWRYSPWSLCYMDSYDFWYWRCRSSYGAWWDPWYAPFYGPMYGYYSPWYGYGPWYGYRYGYGSWYGYAPWYSYSSWYRHHHYGGGGHSHITTRPVYRHETTHSYRPSAQKPGYTRGFRLPESSSGTSSYSHTNRPATENGSINHSYYGGYSPSKYTRSINTSGTRSGNNSNTGAGSSYSRSRSYTPSGNSSSVRSSSYSGGSSYSSGSSHSSSGSSYSGGGGHHR